MTSESAAIECPFCAYDLRAQSVPRCPECGYTYDWDCLHDPQRRTHPTPFEHHPERNFSAFWHTFGQSLFPRRFWRKIRPEQTILPKRLLGYIGIMHVLLAMVACAVCVSNGFGEARRVEQMRRSMRPFLVKMSRTPALRERYFKNRGSPEAFHDAHFPAVTVPQASVAATKCWARQIVVACLWPGLTFGSLLLFRWSMQRARITARHVLRCVAYTSDVMLWQFLLMVLLSRGLIPSQFFPWLLALSYAIAGYRIAVAYRIYMHMHHSVAVGAVSQLIVVFSILCLNLPIELALSF